MIPYLSFIGRTEEAAKYLEATKLQTSNGYSEEFTVMEDLMGLAIGEWTELSDNHFHCIV